MYDDDALEWESTRVDNSRPPLRWIANLFGSIGGWAILRLSYAEEYEKNFQAKIYGFIFDRTYPLYQKYGTYYKVNVDMEDWS